MAVVPLTSGSAPSTKISETSSEKPIVSAPAAVFAATIASRKVHSSRVQPPVPASPPSVTVNGAAPAAAGAPSAHANSAASSAR